YRVNYVYNYHEREKILKDKSLNVDTGAYTKHIFDEVKDKDEMTQMQYFDINTWLPFDILQKADRMSMANSLEVRTPLVDREVAKFAATVTITNRMQGDRTKTALRKAAQAELPQKVANKEKVSSPSPEAEWMKELKCKNMIDDTFTSDVAKKFFDTDPLLEIFKEHVN